MKTDDLILRNKSVRLIGARTDRMAVNIRKLSREPVLSNGFLNAIRTVQLDITDAETDTLVAQASVTYQAVYSGEESKKNGGLLDKMLEPVFFTQLNNLLGDIRLPSLDYGSFSGMYGKVSWESFPGAKLS